MYNDYNTDFEILKDVNSNGKDNNWKTRKLTNLKLAESYHRLGFKKSTRVEDCGTFLEFRVATDKTLKLTGANFCKVRLCPMCAWRRSLKIFGQVSAVMDYVEDNYNYKYLFLTLTVKNCSGDELESTLKSMSKAFNSMTRRKAFKQAVKGYFRALEVTYNKEKNTYHPHFHIILAVNNSYFTDTKIYLSQKSWTDLWQSALKIDYTPIVDIRKIDAVESNQKFGSVVAEVAKYSVKADDYLIYDEFGEIDESLTDEVVKTLDEALAYKRLTAFGFVFKEVHKLLNLDDAEDGDLVDTDNEDLREDLTDIILRYSWNIGIKNYKLVQVAIDEQEDKQNIIEVDGQLVDAETGEILS